MRFSLIILLCCCTFCVQSQTDSAGKASGTSFLPPVSIYRGQVKQFAADNLGNVYVLTPAGLLIKLNNKGDSLNVFNDVRRYGTVYAIDVTNPMKVLLYYKDFSTVVMLDRYLSRINMIDLRKSGIFQAKAMGLSYDNNVWIFDEQSAKLKKIDETGDEVEHLISLGFYTRMKYRFGSSVIEETQPILTDIAKRILKAVNI